MNRTESSARRHARRAAPAAGLVLLLVPAVMLPRAPQSGAEAPVAAEQAVRAPQDGGARALLAAVRGIHPAACELVVRSAGNGGWEHGAAEDAPATARDREDARRVLAWLGEKPTEGDAAALREGLGDSDGCVRRVSARLLARDGVPGGVDALLDALRSGDPEVRGGAAWALGHTDAPEAVAPLASLTGDREPGVRRAAARALGRLEAESAVPALAQLLAADPDPGVRRAAAWALGQME